VPAGLDARHVNKMNQLKTDTFNKVIGTENIFALGDIACIETELYPKGYPQMASVAIDQAKNLANNFMSLANEDELMPFQYINKGSMATVGRNKAVVDLAKPAFSFHGFFAWVVWMSLHLFLLIGFKNKLQVFVNWVYKYVTRHQSLSIFFEPIAGMKNERFKRPKKDNN
jgi:NADH dehydrogenase